jgi:hypothetical protein
MKTVDRVMSAYLKTRKLTEEEASRVRAELSRFIDELMFGESKREPPTSSER